MLVLTRKEDQKIMLSEVGVVITVVKISDGSVKLGIEAPDDITILREELKHRKW